MVPKTSIPVYKLYGEEDPWLTPDLVHCESIAARSQLHNWHIKPHKHHHLFQMLYLKKGKAKIRLDDAYHALHAGQVLLVPQMCVHGFHFNRAVEGTVLTIAYPLIEKIGGGCSEGLQATGAYSQRRPSASQNFSAALSALMALNSPEIIDLTSDDSAASIGALFALIEIEYRRNALHRTALMESLLTSLMIWAARHLSAIHVDVHAETRVPAPVQGSHKQMQGSEHFVRFCALLDASYTEQHTVAAYAQGLGISAAHLNLLCRNAVNRSALELIHQRLLLEAKRNLVYTTMSVSVLAYAIGFADPAYFTRFFKRLAGVSPRDFRLQAQAALH